MDVKYLFKKKQTNNDDSMISEFSVA